MHKHGIRDLFKEKPCIIDNVIFEEQEDADEGHFVDLKKISRKAHKSMQFYHTYSKKRCNWVLIKKPRFKSQQILL